MKAAGFVIGLMLASAAAEAQQIDSRIAPQLVQALQAQLALRDAVAQAERADAEAQKATLWEWLVEAKRERPEGR